MGIYGHIGNLWVNLKHYSPCGKKFDGLFFFLSWFNVRSMYYIPNLYIVPLSKLIIISVSGALFSIYILGYLASMSIKGIYVLFSRTLLPFRKNLIDYYRFFFLIWLNVRPFYCDLILYIVPP